MKIRVILMLVISCIFMVCTTSAQDSKEKKSTDGGVGMNKSENRLSVKSSETVQKGVQVETRSVEEIINTAALCKYTVKLKDPAIFKEQGVCWGKDPQPDITGNKIPVSEYKETEINGEITGLEPDMKYYVRAYVTTNAGTVYGKELSFSTPSGQGVSTYWIRRR